MDQEGPAAISFSPLALVEDHPDLDAMFAIMVEGDLRLAQKERLLRDVGHREAPRGNYP